MIPRITISMSKVPGHDGKGFSGTCLPKDITALAHEMEISGNPPLILNAAIERNNSIDRPQQDWKKKIGRSFIDEK